MIDQFLAVFYLAVHDAMQFIAELLRMISDPQVSMFHGLLAIIALVGCGFCALFCAIALCLLPIATIGVTVRLCDSAHRLFKRMIN